MAAKPPVKFKSKDEIKDFIDEAWKSHGLKDREELARMLGISTSALYGYIWRLEIPERVHQKFAHLAEEIQKANMTKESLPAVQQTSSVDLAKVPLDDLVKEIESRGWRVDLGRIPKDK